MSYKRNKRKKMMERKRKWPILFAPPAEWKWNNAIRIVQNNNSK